MMNGWQISRKQWKTDPVNQALNKTNRQETLNEINELFTQTIKLVHFTRTGMSASTLKKTDSSQS